MAKKAAGNRPEKGKKESAASSASSALPPSGTTPPPGPSAVLDTSSAGGPFIPAGTGGVLGSAGAGSSPLSPNEELVVEVELAPGSAPIGAALAGDTQAFLAGSQSGAAPPDAGLTAVLREFKLIEARPVFTAAQTRDDEARTSALRAAAVTGALASDQIAALERLPSLANFIRLRFPAGTAPEQVTAALKRLPEVARAVPVPRAAPPMPLATAQPTDPLIGFPGDPVVVDPTSQLESQWYLYRTRVLQAWRYSRGSNVVIADVDWGCRTSHQEFSDAIKRTYNAVSGDTNVTQGASAAHGTAVLGIAGARATGVGIAGYAPEASLWVVQGDSSPASQAFQEPWAEAIDFVRRTDSGNQRKVIIVEVQTGAGGNYEQVPSVHRAIRAAIADNCVVCVAAGNGNRPADRTDLDDPFDPTGSILVGATAYDPALNKRAWFSNFGSRVVVSAPGDQLHDVTCGQAGDTAYRNGFGGTSGATPKVAGVAALMLSVNPRLTHGDVREILASTGARLAEDPGKPVGVFLNAEAAVAEALRRFSESAPGETVLAPDGSPIPEVLSAKALHGVRRRRSQLVLPNDTGALSWDASPEEAPPSALEAATAPTPGEQPPPGDKTLQFFRQTVEGTLTQQDRILIVNQAIQMLDNFYVHRPLKEAIYAVRPIQRLRVLLRRMQQASDIPIGEQDELTFHNRLTEIFNSVRDLHTNYQLPRPYRDYIAYLPFEVAPFYEDGQRRYLVTRVMPGYRFAEPDFGPGVELIYWSGMPIDRAVLRTADQTAGSNEAARHARGVSALTLRPMNTTLPPDADFVDVEFVPAGLDGKDPAQRRRTRQYWFVRSAPTKASATEASASGAPTAVPSVPQAGTAISSSALASRSSLDLGRESVAQAAKVIFDSAPPQPPATAGPAAGGPATSRATNLALAAALGLDTVADAVREARLLIFDPGSLRTAQSANIGDEVKGIAASASPSTIADTDATTSTDINVKVPWNAAFRARTIDVAGRRYGHIQIQTFNVGDDEGFVREFIRLLGQMPDNGLILDVRGNGGGNIWAAERLLQTMSPVPIVPERMQFVVTPGTVDLARNHPATSQIPLDDWLPSLEEAVETGSVYSHAFPLTAEQRCNDIGQKYYGPVLLLVDGNCYSATDMFAAGFQDHGIGEVVGVGEATGAGGANVWEHSLLTDVLPPGWGLKPLPNKAGMRVAIRQCLRVGPRAGALLEDFGVVPKVVYQLERADLLSGDRELLRYAADRLSSATPRSILVENLPSARGAGWRQLNITTRGLDRLDFFINQRPEASINLTPDPTTGLANEKPSIQAGAAFVLLGYHQSIPGRPAALYRG